MKINNGCQHNTFGWVRLVDIHKKHRQTDRRAKMLCCKERHSGIDIRSEVLYNIPSNWGKQDWPGKLKRLSTWPLGEGLDGGVALGGLLWAKGAGEEGVEDVVEEGLLLESRWLSDAGWSWWEVHIKGGLKMMKYNKIQFKTTLRFCLLIYKMHSSWCVWCAPYLFVYHLG